jgi:hypothetical protein
MTFKEIVREVEKYCHVEGANIRELIKGFINESVLDFIRLDEWKWTEAVDTISLDDSDTYDLIAELSNPFHGEIALVDSSGEEYVKLSYKDYLRTPDKTYYWAIMNTTLYCTGNNLDVHLIYKTTGDGYPLTADGDEIPIIIYYWDIIKRMAIVHTLEHLGDETGEVERRALSIKIDSTKNHENRIKKRGKANMVFRG